MSSGGLRLGAIPSLRVKDLESIDIDNFKIYKVNVYAKSKSRYFTFCTPECRNMIDSYIEYRRRWAERITDDSPLFRADYNIHKTTIVKPITNYTIRGLTAKLLSRSGLRKPHTEGRTKRSHIMANHGFRKFFETNAFKAGMDPMYLRRLMGQRSGLEDAYLKLSEEELLEGDSRHTGYVDIIDQLTINEENRLKREVKSLREENTQIQKALFRIDRLYDELGIAK